MASKTTFAGDIIYSLDEYKCVFLDEVMLPDGTPDLKNGILSFPSETIGGPTFSDWIENFQKFFSYLLDRGWCIKWTECSDAEMSLKEIKTSEEVGADLLYKGEILAGSDEFKHIWLRETFDNNSCFSGIDIFVSTADCLAISAKYQVTSYRDVLVFLKQVGWAVLWTTIYPNLIVVTRHSKNIQVGISVMQQRGFISELRDLRTQGKLLFKPYQSECLLLLKRGDQLAIDASSETQLTIELDDLTLQQLINVLQHHLDIKSKDALEFKLSSRGVRISPSSIEDLEFYIAEDTDY